MCHALICIFCIECAMIHAGLVGLMQRGQRVSVNLCFPALPRIAWRLWNESVTSLALYSTLHSVCIIHVQICPTPQPCVLCDLSGGQRHLYSCGWGCGIAANLIGALSLHEGLAGPLSVVPSTHLLYQFTAVIYIIQTTGGCLWAPNHLLAFIS